jgi:hypothetical protein
MDTGKNFKNEDENNDDSLSLSKRMPQSQHHIRSYQFMKNDEESVYYPQQVAA